MIRLTLALLLGLVPAWSDDGDIDMLPVPLKPNAYRVGELIPDIAFTDLEGKSGKLSDYKEKAALVVALNAIDCPISQKYAPRLVELEKKYPTVGFLLVNVGKDSVDKLKAAVATWKMTARYIPDYDHKIAKALDGRTTTEMFVLDSRRTLVYRGPVDDQYGLGVMKPEAQHPYLETAIQATLEGRAISERALSAPGCAINLSEVPEIPVTPTFHGQVERIVHQQCRSCHRPGEAGPFSLITYDDVKDHAPTIKFMVSKNLMPPWFANPAHGTFSNDASLSARQKAHLLAWIQNGMPKGETTEAPLATKFPEGWQIGTPDLQVSIPKAIAVPASGVVPYQYVTVRSPLDVDRWVSAVEIQVDQAPVVHHVVIFDSEKPPEGDGQREIGDNGFFAARVPGNTHAIYPERTAKLLKAGAYLTFQIHYTPNGVAVEDRPVLGIKFLKEGERPEHVITGTSAYNTKFKIPAGDPNYLVTAKFTFEQRSRVIGFMPHMHLRGKAFRYQLMRKDGSQETLLDVPRYDFNWQLNYRLARPVLVEAGDTILASAWYDNSEGNPSNPNPKIEVGYGEQTFQEMMFGFFDYYPVE